MSASSSGPASGFSLWMANNGLGMGSSGVRFVPPLDNAAWEDLNLSTSSFEVVIKQATHQFYSLETILDE